LLKKILFVITFFLNFNIQSQDPVFTQFFANALQLNPALAG